MDEDEETADIIFEAELFRRMRVMEYTKWIGMDYIQHLDETYDRVHERGYSCLLLVEIYPESLGFTSMMHIERQPPLAVFKPELGKRNCPYGGWFDWQIWINSGEKEVHVQRRILDPDKLMGKNDLGLSEDTFYTDRISDVFPASSEEELRETFRKNALEALSQIRDFSHLRPEPPIIPKKFPQNIDYGEVYAKAEWHPKEWVRQFGYA